MLEVIPLFISACRNAEENFADYPRYLLWDMQGWGGWDGRTPLLVEWCLPEPLLWWLPVGPYDLWGWMALSDWPYENQWSVFIVSSLDGGSRLEGSQKSSSPSDPSNPTRNRHCASFPTQDNEAWIPGKRRGSRLLDSLLTLISKGGRELILWLSALIHTYIYLYNVAAFNACWPSKNKHQISTNNRNKFE